jgi:hypothetical protein
MAIRRLTRGVWDLESGEQMASTWAFDHPTERLAVAPDG